MFGLTTKEERLIETGPKRAAMALRILYYVSAQRDGATADECMVTLGLSHQSASARYHELVVSRCLIPTGHKRATRSGAAATVHQVAPDADFKVFLATASKRTPKKYDGLTQIEQEALSASMDFIRKWNRTRTKTSRTNSAVALIKVLGDLAKRCKE